MLLYLFIARVFTYFFEVKRVLAWVKTSSGAKREVSIVFLQNVQQEVQACAEQVPFRARCLEQALATRMYLNRQKVTSTLYFGIKKDDDNIKAHAWLKVGNYIITGAEGHEAYKVIFVN